MEPRLPETILQRLADPDRSVLEQIIARYPFLTEDIITHEDYQSLRSEFERERAALHEQIRSLNAQFEHFGELLRDARHNLAGWETWRDKNWDSRAGMTIAEQRLHVENDTLRNEVSALQWTLRTRLAPVVRKGSESDPEELTGDLGDSAGELRWPWPITTPPEGSGGSSDLFFPNKYSGLWLCGYRIGKTSSMSESERRRFLDHFFRNRLPVIVSRYHADSYGEPGTEERLRKMANVMAANCRNFKKNDADKYEVAIADYEQDLDFLKQKYYRAGSFPWPPTED
jgi:hypothetical protein